jgi:hypothetical protein
LVRGTVARLCHRLCHKFKPFACERQSRVGYSQIIDVLINRRWRGMVCGDPRKVAKRQLLFEVNYFNLAL